MFILNQNVQMTETSYKSENVKIKVSQVQTSDHLIVANHQQAIYQTLLCPHTSTEGLTQC